MPKFTLCACLSAILLGFTLPAGAQPSQEELIEKRDAKLQSEFLKKAKWVTDYDEARKLAKESDKLILAYFTRSYSP